MKKGSIFKSILFNNNKKQKQNETAFIACLIFVVVGTFVGTFVIANCSESVLFMMQNQLDVMLEKGGEMLSIGNFFIWFFPDVLILFFCLVVSFSPFGTFVLAPLLMLKGFGIGLFCGNLVVIYGLKGLVFSSVVFMPAFIIKTLGIVELCQNGINFANNQFEILFFKAEILQKQQDNMKSLLLSFFVANLTTGFGVIVSCVSISLFGAIIV